MTDMIGMMVEVGTGETIYEGKLVEINEYEIYLEADSGWVMIPMERVAYVREKSGD
jgi:hypothetical protein